MNCSFTACKLCTNQMEKSNLFGWHRDTQSNKKLTCVSHGLLHRITWMQEIDSRLLLLAHLCEAMDDDEAKMQKWKFFFSPLQLASSVGVFLGFYEMLTMTPRQKCSFYIIIAIDWDLLRRGGLLNDREETLNNNNCLKSYKNPMNPETSLWTPSGQNVSGDTEIPNLIQIVSFFAMWHWKDWYLNFIKQITTYKFQSGFYAITCHLCCNPKSRMWNTLCGVSSWSIWFPLERRLFAQFTTSSDAVYI